MKHTRILLALAVVLCVSMPLAAANMDLVVMVDTSTSMFPYFDDLMHFLIQDLLTTKLHSGDTFHLLSFNSTPEVELSLDMGSEEAAEKAFGRLLLLQPLGRYTDLVAALQFLYHYTKELPDSNPKTILLVTDGVHDPPPNSPNRGDPEKIKKAIEEITGSIKKEGWTLRILKVPAEPAPGEEGLPSYLPEVSEGLGVPIVPYRNEDKAQVTGEIMGYPTLLFPPALGSVGSRFVAPFRVKNFSADPIIVRLSSVQSESGELLERTVTIAVAPKKEAALNVPLRLPSSMAAGDYSLTVKLSFEDDIRISPTEGTLRFTYTGRGGMPALGLTLSSILYAVLGAVGILLLVALFLFLRRKLHEVPLAGIERAAKRREETALARPAHGQAAPAKIPLLSAEGEKAASQPSPARAEAPVLRERRKLVPLLEVGAPSHAGGLLAASAAGRRPTVESLRKALPQPLLQRSGLPPMIEMRASDQNSHIGFRNIHRIPQGGSLSVGGRFSSYLIYFVPVPRGIAEIRNEGGRYTFVPLRKEFFPGLPRPLVDCIAAEIPMVTPKGYTFTIRFREWVSPLDEINALMRSIHHEGKRS
jgi:hypothetical protein